MSDANASGNSILIETTPHENKTEIAGISALRTAALLLVVLQHGLSVLSLDRYDTFRSINIGQLGVSLFMAISGYLAASNSDRPQDWIWRRLNRLFPAYWLAMLVSFGITLAVNYKPVSIGQFISQMLGLGLYTHAGRLVNTPTWFVSLLLLCYAIVYFDKRFPTARATVGLVISLAIWKAWISGADFVFPGHFVAFFVAYTLGSRRVNRWTIIKLLAAGVLFEIVAYAFRPLMSLLYPAIALPALALAPALSIGSRMTEVVSKYSYEYYLVHSICFVGFARCVADVGLPLAVALALASSALMAVVLKELTDCIAGRRRAR